MLKRPLEPLVLAGLMVQGPLVLERDPAALLADANEGRALGNTPLRYHHAPLEHRRAPAALCRN
eukprot:4846747-Pyramimonas_sp.AAC.1